MRGARGVLRHPPLARSLTRHSGARLGTKADCFAADIVTHVRQFSLAEVKALKKGAVTISLVAPAQNKELVAALAAQGVTALGLDCIPRMLSRAQAFDVLSSQVRGWRARTCGASQAVLTFRPPRSPRPTSRASGL